MAIVVGNYKITSRYGDKNEKLWSHSGGHHYGTDLAIPEGSQAQLPEGSWEVIKAGDKKDYDSGYGNSVFVRNKETGELLRYSHLSKIGVKAGDNLDGGSVIGTTGSTGNSTGPHLDIEYYDKEGRVKDILKSNYSSHILQDKKEDNLTDYINKSMNKAYEVKERAKQNIPPEIPQYLLPKSEINSFLDKTNEYYNKKLGVI